MEILKFDLSSESAAITMPIKNDKRYTQNHIHKVMIQGMLGGMIGILEDYNHKDKIANFYKELSDLEIAIVPDKPIFAKFIDTRTNVTGCFNAGTTYINEYETLLNPKWTIYIKKNDNKHFEKIKEFLLKGKSYIKPFIGTNWNFAEITNIEILEGEETDLETEERIDSLFVKDDTFDFDGIESYYLEEYMPTGYEKFDIQLLEKDENGEFKVVMEGKGKNKKEMKSTEQWQYRYENMCFTDDNIYNDKDIQLIKCDNKCLYFV